jgi:N-acetyl-gamma-glutamyl-phosphate reductase
MLHHLTMVDVGVIGASGFTGAELLRLCAQHPDLDIRVATGDTQAGSAVADLYPSLGAAYGSLTFSTYDASALDGLDLVFLGLPHGASQAIVPELVGKIGHLVDLGADFRLQDASLYPQWYGEAHTAPELLPDFAYGLPELCRAEIRASDHVATPGCYPTAALLALKPLVRSGLVATDGIIVDAASGVSGAGRPPKPNTTFCTVDEDFTAYGLLDHRHTPEMEQLLGASVLFTPHLAPMNRGILATCYVRPTAATSTAALLGCLRDAYTEEPFVVVTDASPSTKATLGSNCAHVTARFDERTGWVVAIAAIDNLTKGASGAAVQCANLLLDLPETTGLPIVGVYP